MIIKASNIFKDINNIECKYLILPFSGLHNIICSFYHSIKYQYYISTMKLLTATFLSLIFLAASQLQNVPKYESNLIQLFLPNTESAPIESAVSTFPIYTVTLSQTFD